MRPMAACANTLASRRTTALRQAYGSFSDAQRLSHTGSFITDIVADRHNWSAESFRIFEFAPGTKVNVQAIRDLVLPGDLEAALRTT